MLHTLRRERDVVDIADRLAIQITEDDLIDLVACEEVYVEPHRIGHDVRRLFGADDQDIYENILAERGLPRDDVDSQWASFDRERLPTDRLVVDIADDARSCWNWVPGPELAAALDRLQDLADAKRAELGALDETEWQLAGDRDHAAWLASGEPDWNAEYDLKRAARNPMPTIVPFPPPARPLPDLIQSSAEFVRGFVPPEYLLDQVLQRRFCYSLTAQTGTGKTAVAMLLAAHVSAGRPLGSLDVAKGSVIYFAAENSVDVQMRWLGLTREMRIDPATADVHFIPGAMPLSQIAERITLEIVRKGLQPALVIVDTSAAVFGGGGTEADENSNSQAADHARRIRSLTTLPGGPCVLVLCHPTKRAAEDDLIPRGGGAFLAEVDGNVALQKRESLVVASAQGKFRGPEFSPLSFELVTVRHHPDLKDSRGRFIPTVVARFIDGDGMRRLERTGRTDEDALLRAVDRNPGANPTDLAKTIGWILLNGEPYHVKAKRKLDALKKSKLVEDRRGGWHLTKGGELALNEADRAIAERPAVPVVKRPEQGCSESTGE